MNPLLKPVALLLSVLLGCWCPAQQMVQTQKDLMVLCQKEEQFRGKPLTYLFAELKPPIKLVLAQAGWVPEVAPLFTFFFTPMDVYKQYRREDNFPLRLTVYLEEPFTWEPEQRKGYKDKEHYLDWTKEDEEKYGHLIITAIRVAGDYHACDYEPGQKL